MTTNFIGTLLLETLFCLFVNSENLLHKKKYQQVEWHRKDTYGPLFTLTSLICQGPHADGGRFQRFALHLFA